MCCNCKKANLSLWGHLKVLTAQLYSDLLSHVVISLQVAPALVLQPTNVNVTFWILRFSNIKFSLCHLLAANLQVHRDLLNSCGLLSLHPLQNLCFHCQYNHPIIPLLQTISLPPVRPNRAVVLLVTLKWLFCSFR